MTTESRQPPDVTADWVATQSPAGAASRARRSPWVFAMTAGRDSLFRALLMAADVVSAAVGLVAVAVASGQAGPAAGLLVLPVMVLFAKLGGCYDRDELVLRKSTLEETPALLTLAGAMALVWCLITYLTSFDSRLHDAGVVVLWAATAIALVVTRVGARRVAQLTAPSERVLIVGSAAARERLAQSLATDPMARLQIVGFLPLEDERRVNAEWPGPSRRSRPRRFEDLDSVVQEMFVDRVFLIPTSADGETILEAVRRIARLGVKVSIVPRLFEVVGSAVAFDMVGGVTVLGVRRPGLSLMSQVCKRLMDIVGSGVCLLLLSPLMVSVAIAIKLDSPGDVFFRQRRVGRDGKIFQILKFRSMVDGAEAQRSELEPFNESSGNFKLARDPRTTRVGGLLRRCSIDELPQLINVLKGDMSLVGPRPLVLAEDRLVQGRHRDRLHLAPGMTGPWQLLGPVRPPLSEMVKTDYLYAVNWSIWSDVKLMLRTVSHVAGRRGL